MMPAWKISQAAFCLNCLIAICALIFTAAAVNRAAPMPEVTTVSQKLRFFSSHKDEYDTIFIGSSRLYRQISPRVFDAELKASGHETKSINLAIDGMMLPESWYFFDQVMDQQPANLKWIIVELTDLDFKIPKSHRGTMNSVYWHDWKRMQVVLGEFWKLAASDLEKKKKLKKTTVDLLALHTPLFFQSFTNLGRGYEFIESTFNREAPKPTGAMGIGRDGYIAPPHPSTMNRDVKPEYRLALKKLGEPPRERDTRLLRGIATEMARTAHSRSGVSLLFIVPPTMKPIRETWIKGEKESKPVVFSFNDPVTFPQFYDENRRMDMEHINRDAGIELTKLFAARFAEHLNAGN